MFYIQPPKGLVTLHNLEDIVLTRLEYLSILESNKDEIFNGKFEYLFTGSSYDYIGHFTLRLLTLRYNDFFLSWLHKETLLLKKRLSSINPKQLYKLLQTIIRHVKRRDKINNPVDNVLIKICSFYAKPTIFKHITKSHADTCTEYHYKSINTKYIYFSLYINKYINYENYVSVDFELLPDLVEAKCVDLSRGSAVTYCSQWKLVFQSLFQTFILFEVKTQDELVNHFLADPRINSICQKFYHCSFSKNYNLGKITALNINDEVNHFPPCMEHLHTELRHKHRLSHYARFYYTLFLKECGMSLEDAIVYWKNEYSKPHTCNSVCTHDWHKDSKKFVYSIRHMYGLEGGKKNYKTPSCKHICEETPNTSYEGGCPFKNFDIDSLINLLSKSMTESELSEFKTNLLNQRPEETCASYFKLKSNKFVGDITITNPVQYYREMTKFN